MKCLIVAGHLLLFGYRQWKNHAIGPSVIHWYLDGRHKDVLTNFRTMAYFAVLLTFFSYPLLSMLPSGDSTEASDFLNGTSNVNVNNTAPDWIVVEGIMLQAAGK